MYHTETQNSPSREALEELENDFKLIKSNKLATSLLNGIPIISVLLNKNRQLVFGNRAFHELMGISEMKPLLGLKPGELFGCRNLEHATNGCGSSKNCKACGALKSAQNSLETGEGAEECTINTHNGALNFFITTQIVNFHDKEFILYSMQDISGEKKRMMLERIFYHDILNTAHNISGMAELLASGDFEDSREEFLGLLLKSSARMIDEIHTHRLISFDKQIEQPNPPVSVNSLELFKEMESEFKSFTNDKDLLKFDSRSEDFNFMADRVLLNRVVTNMIKNAFEAEMGNGVITLGIIPLQKSGAMIWVNNPTHMTDEVQMQIFNRSFSTKGKDRGLGTYSMKIITEKYLKGKIYFTSKPVSGTTFIIEVPG